MEIRILEMIEGAQKARGLTVVIDVFRAFSLEAYLFAAGADKIYAVGGEETARALKEKHPAYVLIGERRGRIIPGFDYGNSPSQTKEADLRGNCAIHTTSAGTQGIVNASKADKIITGSLVNAKAIAAYIKEQNPEIVSLVAMGLAGRESSAEDVLCARYIKSLLEEKPLDMEEELRIMSKDSQSTKFFREDLQHVFPKEDFYMCTDYDRFDFVLQVDKVGEDIFCVTRV